MIALCGMVVGSAHAHVAQGILTARLGFADDLGREGEGGRESAVSRYLLDDAVD